MQIRNRPARQWLTVLSLSFMLVGSLLLGSQPAAASGNPPQLAPNPGLKPASAVNGCTLTFTDVPAGSIFADDIHYLACREAINGYVNGNGTFRFEPNSNIRRGEFAKIGSLSFGLPGTAYPYPVAAPYPDVPFSHTFYPYIQTMTMAGLVHSYPDGRYHANDTVSRAELARVLAQVRAYAPITPTVATFADVPAGNPAYSAIETLVARGLVSGQPCGTGRCFYPTQAVRRGELSKLLHRLMLEDVRVPATPSNLVYKASDNTISWQDNATNEEGYLLTTCAWDDEAGQCGPASYTFYPAQGQRTTSIILPAASKSSTQPSCGAMMYYYLTAYNSAGLSQPAQIDYRQGCNQPSK